MEKFLKLFENVKEGPVSTIIGLIMFLLGAVLIYLTYKSEDALVWMSVEVGVFACGALLLLKNDEWITKAYKSIRNKNGTKG